MKSDYGKHNLYIYPLCAVCIRSRALRSDCVSLDGFVQMFVFIELVNIPIIHLHRLQPPSFFPLCPSWVVLREWVPVRSVAVCRVSSVTAVLNDVWEMRASPDARDVPHHDELGLLASGEVA